MASATSGPIATPARGGASPGIGLTGLSLTPEGLRRPFGFERALVKPSDFESVGSEPSHLDSRTPSSARLARHPSTSTPTISSALSAGERSGAQSPHLPSRVRGSRPPATPLRTSRSIRRSTPSSPTRRSWIPSRWPKGRSVLRAARLARRETLQSTGESRDARAFCKLGGTIVTAPPVDPGGAARENRGASGRADAGDPVTRSLVTSIDALPAAVHTVAPCSHPADGRTARSPCRLTLRAERIGTARETGGSCGERCSS